MGIPQWVRTVVGLVMVVGIVYLVWVWKWWIIGACLFYAIYKGLTREEG